MKNRIRTEPLRIEWKGSVLGVGLDRAIVKDDLIALARAIGRLAARRDLAAVNADAAKAANRPKAAPSADASKEPQKTLQ